MTVFSGDLRILSSASAIARRQPNGEHAACILRSAPSPRRSNLTMNLLALGCELISDEVVGFSVSSQSSTIKVHAGDGVTRGLIENRDVGLLRYATVDFAPVKFIVDLHDGKDRRDLVRDPRIEPFGGVNVAVLDMNFSETAAAAIFALLGDAEAVHVRSLEAVYC